MDNPVHNRRSALDIQPSKRIPPSFYAALAIAIAVHAGFAYYLLEQRFGTGLVPTWDGPPEPPPISVDMEKPKPAPPVEIEKEIIQVHKTPIPATPVETTPMPPLDTPVPPGQTVTEGPPVPPIAGGGTGTGTGTDVAPGPVYVKAQWSRFPNGAALTDYYPARAMENEVEGSATVQCVVLDTAGRVSCATVSEKPGGYGFGSATVRMVQEKGRVDISQGNVQVGSVLRQTVSWRLD